MPQLAFANSFWESFDALEQPCGRRGFPTVRAALAAA
jgi:hypothetical protein